MRHGVNQETQPETSEAAVPIAVPDLAVVKEEARPIVSQREEGMRIARHFTLLAAAGLSGVILRKLFDGTMTAHEWREIAIIFATAALGYFVIFQLLGILADRSQKLEQKFLPSVLTWALAAGLLVAGFGALTMVLPGGNVTGRFVLVSSVIAAVAAGLIRLILWPLAEKRNRGWLS